MGPEKTHSGESIEAMTVRATVPFVEIIPEMKPDRPDSGTIIPPEDEGTSDQKFPKGN